MLTIAFVTGTEPGKWFRRFEELSGTRLSTIPSTDPFSHLDAEADIALMRLPDPRVGDEHHVVRLYVEALGVAVPKDSIYAEMGNTVAAGDLEGEISNFAYQPGSDPASSTEELRAALQVVAANVGIAYAPLPLLKALSKKLVVPLELLAPEDGPQARATQIGLVWLKARDSEPVQDFVGVAKGRTVRSSRSQRFHSVNRKTRARHKGQEVPSRNRKRGRRPR